MIKLAKRSTRKITKITRELTPLVSIASADGHAVQALNCNEDTPIFDCTLADKTKTNAN